MRGLGLLIGGLLAVIMSLGTTMLFDIRHQIRIAEQGVETTALIQNVQERYDYDTTRSKSSSGRTRTRTTRELECSYTMAYSYAGQSYTHNTGWSSSNCSYRNGESRIIQVDPQNPNYVVTDKNAPWFFAAILLVIGSVGLGSTGLGVYKMIAG